MPLSTRLYGLVVLAVSLLSLIFNSSTASAADLEKFMVRGRIMDEKYKSVDSVEVSITLNDTVKIPFKLLVGNDEKRLATGGQLRAMVSGGMGNYTLTLYKEGFEPLMRDFKIASVSEDVKYIPDLIMKPERFRQLEEVTVQATRIKMVMKGDTIVYDAGAFNLSEGSMLDALVRQLPGATLSPDGVIEVNGRKINELLVNGKDFFKGDPKVALQNLPSYTVKNLKVYDKADKDAYLTHSDARLDKREEDENLVMDVVLKKEYDTGWLANAEAGYGTHDLYLGRAFGLGYTDKLRIGAFVNGNNTGDHTQGGSSGQWRGASSTENGRQDIFMTGIDYTYDDKKRIEMNGSVTYNDNTDRNYDIAASTRFFPSGDIYGRNESRRRNRSRSLTTQHYVRIKGDNVYASIMPSFSWNRNDNRSYGRSATFTAAPTETYRGEALDSLFSSRGSTSYSRDLLTKLLKNSEADSRDLSGRLSSNFTIRPAKWKGMLLVGVYGNLQRSTNDTRTLYDQTYGPQSTAGTEPLRSYKYSPSVKHSRNIDGSVEYRRDIRRFGDKRTTNLQYAVRANFSHSHNDNDDKLYSTDSLGKDIPSTSAIDLERMMLDRANSPYTSTFTNSGRGILSLGYGSEPTAPGDSTFNPSFNIHFNLQCHHNHENYLLDKPEITRQRLSRSTDFLMPMIQLSFNSSNRMRNIFSYIFYQRMPSAPSLSYFVDNTNSSNPLDIYTGNPDGLANSVNHYMGFGMGRYSRGATNSMFNLNGSWNVMTNSVAYAVRYNPETGVSVHRPENISGNWSANLQASYSCSFGSRRQTTVNISMSTDITNSADYLAINTTPVRSSVLSTNYRPRVSLNYTLKNGSSIETGLTTTIGHQHSRRENFNNMTWYEYWPFIRAFLKLPADMELNTQFNPYFRRGYADEVMNTSEYVWNATLTKNFKRPAIALKLTAADILGSAKHVYTSVDAQGRVETWRQTMPRYVMLSVIYRLDMKPRKAR